MTVTSSDYYCCYFYYYVFIVTTLLLYSWANQMRISGVALCNFKTAFTEIHAPPATKTNIVPAKIWSEIIDGLVKAIKVLNEITLLCNFPSGSNIKIRKNIDSEQFVLIPPPQSITPTFLLLSRQCVYVSLSFSLVAGALIPNACLWPPYWCLRARFVIIQLVYVFPVVEMDIFTVDFGSI